MSVGRGDLKIVILSVLAEGATFGDAIRDAIHTATRGKYTPSRGAIYPRLYAMELQGLIEPGPSGPRRRRNYQLTAQGRSHVAGQRDAVAAARKRLGWR